MRARLVGAVAALVAVALGLWLMLRPREGGGFTVALTADRRLAGPGARVALHARATSRPDVSWVWKTSGGRVVGTGAEVVLEAPQEVGHVVVTVTGRGGGESRSASVDIEIADYRKVDEAARDSTPSERFAGGYELRAVKFEKTDFCQNEDVRVQVDVVDPNGESRWLSAKVELPGFASDGLDAIARTGPMFNDMPEQFAQEAVVKVFDVRYPGIVASRVVPLTIRKCQTPGAGLFVMCAPGTVNETIECRAGADRQDAALPFKPVRFEWTVVTDEAGETAYPLATQTGFLRWDVPLLAPEGAVVNHVFAVKAVGPAGEILEGRASAAISNPAFLDQQQLGLLKLRTLFTTPLRQSNEWLVKVRLGNPFHEAALLDTVTLKTRRCGAAPDEDVVAGQPMPAAKQVGVAQVGPGQEVLFDWTMPADPARCYAEVRLEGHGATSGLPVKAVWIMPTDPAAARVHGPRESARIGKALAILSQRRGEQVLEISSEELDALTEEGVIPPPTDDAAPPATGRN